MYFSPNEFELYGVEQQGIEYNSELNCRMVHVHELEDGQIRNLDGSFIDVPRSSIFRRKFMWMEPKKRHH